MERFRNISKNTILAFALSIAFQILLGNYVVDGNSMDPTLRNDQRVFVNKFVSFDPMQGFPNLMNFFKFIIYIKCMIFY